MTLTVLKKLYDIQEKIYKKIKYQYREYNLIDSVCIQYIAYSVDNGYIESDDEIISTFTNMRIDLENENIQDWINSINIDIESEIDKISIDYLLKIKYNIYKAMSENIS